MDIDYNQVFGIGEQAQETADPAPETEPVDTEGANEQEPAEPAQEDDDDKWLDTTETKPTDDKAEKSKEERAKNAAARRKAEMDAAIAQAREEERKAIKSEHDALLKKLAIADPKSGKTIESIDDLATYEQAVAAQKLTQNLKAGKLTPEDLAEAVAQTEPVKKLAQLAAEAEKAKKEADDAKNRAKIEDELRQIHAIDPNINSVDDLLAMDTADVFKAQVFKGNSFLDAYRLANIDKLTKNAQAAAQQQALNRARSKEHLSATATRGAGAITVSGDEIALYRVMNPNATEAEIQKHYNQYKKAATK